MEVAGMVVEGLVIIFVRVSSSDEAVHEIQTYISLSEILSDLLGNEGLDAEFGGSRFLDEISVTMQEDDLARCRYPVAGPETHLDVDLNEPPSEHLDDTFAMGGTPPSHSPQIPWHILVHLR
ncbi:uncharacterized protein DS421_6g180020 [Arachis hypogaea]|nr:uncharacterized protein DS421_6g180020 [Arachis hypogaea]